MFNSFKVIILPIIFALVLQGCGDSSSSNTNYPTTLGDSSSVTTANVGAIMAPSASTLKSIGSEIGNIIQKNVSTQNQTEATSFTKQTNYCDISGQKELENLGTLEKITNITEYKNCKESQSAEHGKVKIDYNAMDNEGKYPKNLLLTISENYTYNNIELKKGLTLTSIITYDEKKTIKSIALNINGAVLYNYGNYALLNNEQIIDY